MLKEINSNKRYVVKKLNFLLSFILFIVFLHEKSYSCLWSIFIRAKEIEAQLLTACKEDLLKLAEYEEAEEEQAISSEQQ